MKSENKAFLEANRHYWITLRDAHCMMGLSGNTRDSMQRIMGEEFRPGYVTDLWCPTCVADMVAAVYFEFEKWEANEAAKVQALPDPRTKLLADLLSDAKEDTPEKEKPAAPAKIFTTKATFPSHKNRRR